MHYEFHDEEGASLGDPRHCPHHPHVVTSSPDGLFDGVCGECEHAYDEAEEAAQWAALSPEEREERLAAIEASRRAYEFERKLAAACAAVEDNDIPF